MMLSEKKCSESGIKSISALTVRRDSGFIFKSRLIFWSKIIVAVLVLAFIISNLQPDSIITAFDNADHFLLFVTALTVIANIGIQIFKWRFLLRSGSPEISTKSAFKSLLIGYPLAFLTPGRLGEIGRAFFVAELSQFKTLRLVIFDKLSNLVVLFVLGTLSTLLLFQHTLSPVLKVILSLLAFIASGIVILPAVNRALLQYAGRLINILNFSRRQFYFTILFSLGFNIIFICQFSMLVYCFDMSESWRIFSGTTTVLFLKTLAPIAFSDLGIREGAAILVLTDMGIKKASAFNAAFMLFIINILLPTLAGLPLLLKTRARISLKLS